MKKLLIAAVLTLVSVGAFGQGQVIFNNGGATKVTNSVTGQAVAAGTFCKEAMYMAVGFNAPTNSLQIEGVFSAVTGVPQAGLITSTTRTTTYAPGPVTIQVRAWFSANNTYNTFAEAQAAIATDSSLLFGYSLPMNVTLTASPAGPPSLTGSGLNAIVLIPSVPEPSSIALGLLGLGAVALFRRRK